MGRLPLILLLTGCVSAGSLTPAHAMGKGRMQAGLELSYQALASKDAFTSYAMPGMSMRFGVSDRVELGARLGPSGLEALSKFQLTSAPAPSYVLSLAPTAGVSGSDNQGFTLRVYNFGLPLLVGIWLDPDKQLVLGPRLHVAMLYGSAGSAGGALTQLYAGTSVGLAVRHSSGWWLPELSFLYPLALNAARSDGLSGISWFGPKWTLQASFALLIGGAK